MKKLPTDRAILKCIYEMYESAYPGVQPSSPRGENDPYVAIDVSTAASKLGCKPELLFGRLYYHLGHKHRYKQDDGASVPLFNLQVGTKRHAVNYPYLAAILAGHDEEHSKVQWSLRISILAIVISVATFLSKFL